MRLRAKLCWAIATLATTACASVQVETESGPDAGFAGYRSFDWIRPDVREGDREAHEADRDAAALFDPDANPLLDRRIRSAVEAALAARGLVPATGGAPDLHLRYAIQVAPRVRVFYPGYYGPFDFGDGYGYLGSRSDYEYGYPDGFGYGYGAPPIRYRYFEATLILDAIDARRDRLVWRGRGVGETASGGFDERDVAPFVREIVRKFPEPMVATGGG